MLPIVQKINGFLADYILVFLLVAAGLFFFAFSTILGWNMFGKVNVNYLFGKKGILPYTPISLIFIFLGTMMSSDLVRALIQKK